MAALGLAALGAASCTRTSSSANSGDLYIQSCSLGCTDGQGGSQVFCIIVNVFENTEISVLFSEPLDPATIGPATFQVINVTNGTSPDGRYLVDPLDPRRAIFRPAIVFTGGGVTFSFRSNTSYEILIPGQAQGDNPPFIESIEGNPNQSRMQCTIFTSEGVTDPVPGNPQVAVDVDVVTSYDPQGNPQTIEREVIDPFGPPLTDVFRNSTIHFTFNELMNVATVADNATMQAPFITVEIDLDGNLATSDPGDRLPVPGTYELEIDEENLLTFLTFTPDSPYPSAGSSPTDPRRIVIRIPETVVDLTNNPVTTATGGGTLSVIPEALSFMPISIPDADGEGFENPGGTGNSLEDVSHSGSNWGTVQGGETFLAPGLSGGSGRHGEIVIRSGETLVLNTDSQEFPIDNGGGAFDQVDVVGNATGGAYPFSLTVTDGVFELSSLVIEGGGILRLTGTNTARLLVRGPIHVGPGAIVDGSGSNAPEHDSRLPRGGGFTTPVAGLGGSGSGGIGADRFDFTGTQLLNGMGIPPIPIALPPLSNPGAVTNGRTGGGVGGGIFGGGGGGPRFPTTYPTLIETSPSGTNGRVTMNSAFSPETTLQMDCISLQMAGPGGGGAYARAGSVGTSSPHATEPIAEFVPTGAPQTLLGPPGVAGDNSGLALEPPNLTNTGYDIRLLRWENGDLRGGSGGGGGGNHPYMTLSNGPFNDCFFILFGAPSAWTRWHDHSAAAGGSGGAGLELLSGKRIDVDGRIQARGGQGGSSLTGAAIDNFGQYATPGGGGSGGSLRLRATVVDLLPGGTRIDISGGNGGSAFWAVAAASPATTIGGTGSPGLVRIEDGVSGPSQVAFAAIAPLVAPFNAASPNDSVDFLSVAGNFFTTPPVLRPDSVTASSSCWMQPQGNFLSLGLAPDTGPELENQGWTMNVVIDQGGGVLAKRPFRGTTAQFPVDWETQFGNLLGYDLGVGETASPIVVRFQGARTGAVLSAPCDIDPNDFMGPISAGTLTRWVAHPSELDGIPNQLGTPQTPNLVRFVVIFDRTNDPANNDTPGLILTGQGVVGVDDLLIRANPN